MQCTLSSAISILFIGCSSLLFAQKSELYNPDSDAKKDLESVKSRAKTENKHIFIQVGGNWCSWCIAFDKKIKENESVLSILKQNYVVYHLNYSKENKNEEILAQLDYPQRFGFPVFVILDQNGKRLHTQNSAYLEEGQGHSLDKIKEFLLHWTQDAVRGKN